VYKTAQLEASQFVPARVTKLQTHAACTGVEEMRFACRNLVGS